VRESRNSLQSRRLEIAGRTYSSSEMFKGVNEYKNDSTSGRQVFLPYKRLRRLIARDVALAAKLMWTAAEEDV
jgi:hypothetical protein